MAVIKGTQGDDTLTGTDCDDKIIGRGGDDRIDGRGGDDTIYAGPGNDSVKGGAGNDVIRGGSGDDEISGGDGYDYLSGEAGADFISGGDGNDTILGGAGDDTLKGGGGDDEISGGDGNDFISGDAGDDYLSGGTGDDILEGGTGNDTIRAGAGNDAIDGGDGDDSLSGGEGDDFIEGGLGNDEMFGGDGNDTMTVGPGNDEAYGGFGNDTFKVSPGDHLIVGGEDPDGQDVDVLDLSGAGNYTIVHTGPESGIIEFRDEHGLIYRRAQFREIERIICFTPGTGIATMTGEVPVEELKVGSRVFTRDNGAQQIQWIGRKKLSLAEGNLPTKLQPVLIRKGALGHGLPERDIMVSPNHRLLIVGQQAQLYFEEPEVLVAAKHLVGRPGIEHAVQSQVEYIHFLCERHEVVLSNGAWTETFQPGDQSLKGLGQQQREEIFGLFPELRDHGRTPAFGAARRSLRRFEAQLLNS